MATQVSGDLHIANDVLADIAGNAAMECYGVVGMAAPNVADSVQKILPSSRLRRGVVITTTEKGVHIDMYVIIGYGTSLSVVSKNLTDAVTFALREYTRVELDGIDIHVQGVKVR